MSTHVATHTTAEEYLALERAATEVKSEWIDGEIRAMVGASYAHIRICGNLVALLTNRLWDQPFAPLPNDMKIRIPDGPYYYPDVSIVPDPPEFEDDRTDIVLNPLVVVEVTSPSTKSFDRGRKLADYRRLPTLRDYLIVDQDEALVEHHHRKGKAWRSTTARGLADMVTLTAFDVELPLADIYHRILSPSNG